MREKVFLSCNLYLLYYRYPEIGNITINELKIFINNFYK